MRTIIFILAVTAVISSCKKSITNANLPGNWQWTIQYSNNPNFNSTPASTGIQEALKFTGNDNYTLTQNGIITQSGTYKTVVSNTPAGKVSTLLYSNSRVSDSLAYFDINNNGNRLVFSNDLSGTVGSGSRHYDRIP